MTQTEDQINDTLEPFEESFPSSHKIHDRIECNGHVLHVPKRRIHLSNDDDPVDVYDTSGPQGCDVRVGVPKPREARIKARREDWYEYRAYRGSPYDFASARSLRS